jgi:hypothetical protein
MKECASHCNAVLLFKDGVGWGHRTEETENTRVGRTGLGDYRGPDLLLITKEKVKEKGNGKRKQK